MHFYVARSIETFTPRTILRQVPGGSVGAGACGHTKCRSETRTIVFPQNSSHFTDSAFRSTSVSFSYARRSVVLAGGMLEADFASFSWPGPVPSPPPLHRSGMVPFRIHVNIYKHCHCSKLMCLPLDCFMTVEPGSGVDVCRSPGRSTFTSPLL